MVCQAISSYREGCLKYRTALITGGGSGIGKAIAQRFMEGGANVAILSRNTLKLQNTAKELERNIPGLRCFAVTADVRNFNEVSKAVDMVLTEYGRIDILVNAAAGNFLCSVEAITFNGFKAVMEIDAHGTFILSKIVYQKAFKKQSALPDSFPLSHRGTIINISMTLHYCGAVLQAHAGAAKAAVDALTKHLAVEWGPKGVRVVGVAPGPIEGTEGLTRLTTLVQTSTKESVDTLSPLILSQKKLIPLQRFGTSREIADICFFLSLPEASLITGTTIVVDGGHWLTSGNYALLIPAVQKLWNDDGLGASDNIFGSLLVQKETQLSKL